MLSASRRGDRHLSPELRPPRSRPDPPHNQPGAEGQLEGDDCCTAEHFEVVLPPDTGEKTGKAAHSYEEEQGTDDQQEDGFHAFDLHEIAGARSRVSCPDSFATRTLRNRGGGIVFACLTSQQQVEAVLAPHTLPVKLIFDDLIPEAMAERRQTEPKHLEQIMETPRRRPSKSKA